MTSVIRSFIAIDLPNDLQQSLTQVSGNLGAVLGRKVVRWVDTHKIHLTLKFLGDVSDTNIALIKEIIQAEALTHKVFEISVGGLGVFPNMTNPRVIWVGVEAPDELFNIQRRIESEITRLGYPPEKREFSPHLTLGRVSRSATQKEIRKLNEDLRQQKLGFVGAARVTELHLLKSDLKPDGAVYTKLHTAQLGQN